MKIIHTKAVEFLHNNFRFYFPEKVLQPYLISNSLYEAVLKRKGEWK